MRRGSGWAVLVGLGLVQLTLSALLARAIPRELASGRAAGVAPAGAERGPGAGAGEEAGGAGGAGVSPSGSSRISASPTRGSLRAPAGPPPGISGGLVKVGVLVTESGGITFRGASQAAKLFFSLVNQAGGLGGYRFQPIVYDDGLDPNRGVALTKKMILEDKVFALAGWNAPQTELLVAPTIEEYRVPLVGAFGQLPEYSSPYIYPFAAFYWTWGYAMAEFAADLGAKRPGLVYITQDEEANRWLEEGLRRGLASRGKSPAYIRSVDVTTPDYTAVVLELQANQVDVLLSILEQTNYARLLQAMKRYGYTPIHVGSPFLMHPSLERDPSLAPLLEGSYSAWDHEPLSSNAPPQVAEFMDAMRRAYGSSAEIDWSAEVAWTGAKMFTEAFREMTQGGRPPSREALIAVLDSWTSKPTGFTPPVTFRPGAHDPHRCLKFALRKGGVWETVTPWRCTPPRPASAG